MNLGVMKLIALFLSMPSPPKRQIDKVEQDVSFRRHARTGNYAVPIVDFLRPQSQFLVDQTRTPSPYIHSSRDEKWRIVEIMTVGTSRYLPNSHVEWNCS